MKRTWSRELWAAAAVVGLVASSCATTPAGSRLSHEEQVRQLGLDPDELIFPARLTEEMREWADSVVSPARSESERMRLLLRGLLEEDGLHLKYNPHFTGTAAEVFATRDANCLSFTHLFVAMARAIGVDAYYLEVRRQPRFDRAGDLVVVWEHVTAGFGPAHTRTVLEFSLGPEITSRGSRRLSDLRAQAMYYSNRGAETLLGGDAAGAIPWLELSVRLDPLWGQGWLNLGVARRRTGDSAAAEATYRKALEVDPELAQAYHNLYSLLRLRGERDAASEILEVLDRGNSRDPFISLSLGDARLEEGELREARGFYRRALKLAPELGETRAAMGIAAVRGDDLVEARRWLKKAERRDPTGDRTLRLRRLLDEATGGGDTIPPEEGS